MVHGGHQCQIPDPSVKKPTMIGAGLDLLTKTRKRKGLFGNVEAEGSLGCRDHNTVGFRTRRQEKEWYKKKDHTPELQQSRI